MQSGILFCQNFTLPTVILDSLIFEVRKGRSCDSLQVLNERIIKSQGVQLLNQDALVKLTESKVKTLESLVSNAKEMQNLDFQQYAIDLGKEKRKKRKWIKVALVQTVVIVVLILTPK